MNLLMQFYVDISVIRSYSTDTKFLEWDYSYMKQGKCFILAPREHRVESTSAHLFGGLKWFLGCFVLIIE